MQVNGVLNARGTSGNPIVLSGNSASGSQKIEFTSNSTVWNEQSSSGCIIDNALITSVPIVVSGGSPKISNNYFTGFSSASPITVSGGSPSIVNNVIKFSASDGIHVNSGSPAISFNLITGQGQYYGIYTQGAASIFNNNITNCWSGIYASGVSNIQQNNIMNNNNDGVASFNSASTIRNNAIANNYCGVGGTGIIQNNTITNMGSISNSNNCIQQHIWQRSKRPFG